MNSGRSALPPRGVSPAAASQLTEKNIREKTVNYIAD